MLSPPNIKYVKDCVHVWCPLLFYFCCLERNNEQNFVIIVVYYFIIFKHVYKKKHSKPGEFMTLHKQVRQFLKSNYQLAQVVECLYHVPGVAGSNRGKVKQILCRWKILIVLLFSSFFLRSTIKKMRWYLFVFIFLF